MRKATITEQPRDSLNGDLTVNIDGALVVAQAVIPKVSERGAGSILLTGGGFALEPNPDYLSLSIGKAGIRALAHGLFESLKVKGVHVATVTVATFVDSGSNAAQAVADQFWKLHNQQKGEWTVESTYTG